MAFDFFNEGFKKEPAVQFTKQQNDFLISKLPFLDPKKTELIPIGTVLQLSNLSRIGSANIKKIIQNCKIDGKKAITYEEMKRAFRGIALVQKGIEPSTININANIKLPMPKFYDDDDDEEEEEPQKVEKEQKPTPVQQIQSPPSKSPKNSAGNADFAQFGQFPQPKPPAQQPKPQSQPHAQTQPQPVPQPQKQPPSQPNDPMGNKLRQFQAYWTKLNTKHNKIDGNEVKSLCKNLAQRSNLSKAWKVCSKTHSGSLTKGQFYVFLELVSLNQLPQALTEDMKAIIAQIDKTSIPREKPLSNSQLAPPQVFDNFTKSELSINVPPPPAQKPTNQPPIQRPSNTLAFTEIAGKVSGKLEQASKSLKAQQQASAEQLLQLRRQQETMNNMMGQVQQYLMMVNNKNNKVRMEIDELKTNQYNLNERFNKVCMAMNQIISRQNAFIDELVQELATQNNGNEQKMTVLEAYVADRNANCEKVQQEHRVRSVEPNERVKEPSKERNRTSQRVQAPVVVQQFQAEQPPQQPSASKQHIPSPSQQRPASQSAIAHQQQQRHDHEQPQSTQQQIEYMNRMKMKQMQVIQLIHYLTPISQQQYPKIAQKITAYTEEQLNYAYTGLYEKLMEKKRLQQAEKEKEKPRGTGEDEFNTSNFKNEERQAAQGEDFFS